MFVPRREPVNDLMSSCLIIRFRRRSNSGRNYIQGINSSSHHYMFVQDHLTQQVDYVYILKDFAVRQRNYLQGGPISDSANKHAIFPHPSLTDHAKMFETATTLTLLEQYH